MTAGKYDIYIEQGANFLMTLTFKSDGTNPDDLTGKSFTGEIRKKIGGDILASFSFDVLDQTDPLTKGKVKVYLSSVETSAILVKGVLNCDMRTVKYPYDIISTKLGVVERELEGCAIISAKVSE